MNAGMCYPPKTAATKAAGLATLHTSGGSTWLAAAMVGGKRQGAASLTKVAKLVAVALALGVGLLLSCICCIQRLCTSGAAEEKLRS